MFALIAGSMAAKDVAYVAAEYLVSRSRALSASLCDIIGDIASVLTIGVSGAEFVKGGFGFGFLGVCGAIALGSLGGTVVGVRIGQAIEGWPGLRTFRAMKRKERRAWWSDVLHGKARKAGRVLQLKPPPMEKGTLSPEERRQFAAKDGEGRTLFDRLRCTDCGGVHTMACPRIKKLVQGSGAREVEYWPPGAWPTDGIVWLEDTFEDDETG